MWHKYDRGLSSLWAKRVKSNINLQTKYKQWHSPDNKSSWTPTFLVCQIDLHLDNKWHKNDRGRNSLWAKRVKSNINLQRAKCKQWHSPDASLILEWAIFELQIDLQLDVIVVQNDRALRPLAVTRVSERKCLWIIILFHCFDCSIGTFHGTIKTAKKFHGCAKQDLF